MIEDPDEPGTFYGYGLVSRTLDGHECVGHSGGMVGFSSLLVTDAACGIGVIVLLNGSDERMEIARFALAALRAAAAGARVPPPPPPADPTIVGEAAAEYAGAYVAPPCVAAPTAASPHPARVPARRRARATAILPWAH